MTKLINTNMVLKYIVLLFFIYSFGIAKRIDKKEINSLWRNISIGLDFVNEYSLSIILNQYLNSDEIKQLLKQYGHSTYPYKSEIDKEERSAIEYQMSESSFEKFAKAGLMPRWPIVNMKAVFNEILPPNESRDYVTLNEMIKHYPDISSYRLEGIMRKYGKTENGERRLYFKGFVSAMNLDLIPAPIL